MRSASQAPGWLLFAVLACGCSRPSPPRAAHVPDTLAVDVLADSAVAGGLPPARFESAPPARLVLVRVAPARAALQAPLPEPEPAAPDAPPAPGGGLAADDELRPPLPRGPARWRLHAPRRGWVELDVRVDEHGEVSDALAAGGDADSAAVQAAIEAAFGLRWYPATRGGRPVAVWCRQRFELAPRPDR